MSTTRQDAWTNDEDLLLAEVILRNIRVGGTQLQAFEEVGKKLSRTPAACGFRWNSFVRKQYKEGIELAKKQRKDNRQLSAVTEHADTPSPEEVHSYAHEESGAERLTYKEVLAYLDEIHRSAESCSIYKKEKEEALRKLKELEWANEKLAKEKSVLEEDYRSLMGILDRARKMAVDRGENSETGQKAKFQLDKYGSLERIE